MDPKSIVAEIKKTRPQIKSVYFVGCGASKAELYPGKYFLEKNAKQLRAGHYTANEFCYATPAGVNDQAVVITCSLGGTTPETVAASKKAMELGAAVVAVTHDGESPLAKNAHYVLVHGFEKNYAAKLEKMTGVLALAVELLNTYEGYAHYAEMQTAFANIYDLIENTVPYVLPAAKKFAQEYKDVPVLYVMSSGATQAVAYTLSLRLTMEMQWINSGCIHSGEYFHGPFEVTDYDVPFMLVKSIGHTRHLDERVENFAKKFTEDLLVLDQKDLDLSTVADEAKPYVAAILTGVVIRHFVEAIAFERGHSLDVRRYMWQMQY